MSDSSKKLPFALTARALLAAACRPSGDSPEAIFAWWADLADATGPVLLPFLTRPEEYAKAPFEELGLVPTPLKSLTPRRGEMWVLFCFRPGRMIDTLRESALRSDGFPLILEWRKGSEDSPLLSSALRALAAQVRQQFGVDGWCLHPAFDRYGDLIDFSDSELFSDAEHVDNVASAWGALAAGLWCVTTGRFPPEWTFPTIQWDEKRGCAAGVAGLRQKLSVAADCGATVVTVARSQRREATGILQDLRSECDGRRYKNLRLYPVRDRRSPKDAAVEVALGFSDSRRLRHRIAAAILLPLLAALSLWGVYHWDTHRSFSKYYAAVVYHYGLPEGIYEVTPEVQRQRGSTFRFDYQGVLGGESIHRPWLPKTLFGQPRYLVRVVSVNARDVPASQAVPILEQTPVVQEFRYDSGDKLMTVLCRRRGGEDYVHGAVEKIFHYMDWGAIPNGSMSVRSCDNKTFVFPDSSTAQQCPGEPSDEKCRVSDYVLNRDGWGRVTQKLYYHDTMPTTDGDGVGGLNFSYTDEGLPHEVWNLGLDATNRVPDRYGVVSQVYKWRGPDITEITFRDARGKAVFGRQGVRRAKICCDRYGNATNWVNLGTDNLPEYRLRRDGDDDVSTGKSSVFSNGLEVASYLLDATGGRCMLPGLSGVHYAHDERGDIVQWECVDGDDALIAGIKGVAKCVIRRDPTTGAELGIRYYDTDGKSPAYANDERVHEIRNSYDAEGNLMAQSLLDEFGKLMIGASGWASVEYSYYNGRCTLVAFYDEQHRPVRSRGTGYSCARIEYDLQTGSEISRRFYEDGISWTRQSDSSGMWGWDIQRDVRGRPVFVRWLDLDGRPSVSNVYGVAGWRCAYEARDDGSTLVKTTYLEPDGISPRMSQEGYSEHRKAIDRCGRIVEEKYFDARGNRCAPNNTEMSACVYAYGDNGELAEKKAFDASDQSALLPGEGCHGLRYCYNERRQLTNVVAIGESNEPECAEGHNFAEIRYAYDAQGHANSVSFWDEVGNAVIDKVCGFHERRVRCDGFGKWLEVSFWGLSQDRVMAHVDGMHYCRKTTAYDNTGNVTCERYYDADDKLLTSSDGGFAYCVAKYDALHRPVETSFYDSHDQLCECQSGAARLEIAYHGTGLRIARKIFHAAPNPGCFLWRQENVRRAVSEYDATHETEPREITLYGSDGVELASVWVPVVSQTDVTAPAVKYDIRVGDVFCSYGDLCLENPSRYGDIREKCVGIERLPRKRMILARKEGGVYKIRKFDFGPGPTGVRFASTKRTEAEFAAMLSAFQATKRETRNDD